MPRLSGELRPGRSPISTTTQRQPSAWPIGSPMATRPCSTTATGAIVQPGSWRSSGSSEAEQRWCVALHRQRRQSVGDDDAEIGTVLPRRRRRAARARRRRGCGRGRAAADRPRGRRPRCAAAGSADRALRSRCTAHRQRVTGAPRRAPEHGRAGSRARRGRHGSCRRGRARCAPESAAAVRARGWRPHGAPAATGRTAAHRRRRTSSAIRLIRLAARRAPAKAGGTPSGCAASRPSASKMPIRSSQASNSGAGRSPSTRRAYSASWNEVVW